MIILEDGERLDDLNLDGLKIIQRKDGYNFTSDSVLLANFVKTKKTDICVEIGAGCGVISILVNSVISILNGRISSASPNTLLAD